MKRINSKDNIFLVTWLMCLLILVGACNLGFLKVTWSGFGNLTGQLTIPYKISYFSNYPEGVLIDNEQKIDNVYDKNYSVMENKFVLDGYEFVSWNIEADGTGVGYNPNDSIILENSLSFYAQWKKVDVIILSYGDVNLDGVISEDDYLLIEKFISLESELTGQGLLNADVNVDGKIDLVDSDIIRQVCLGTEGYVGMLPNNPILIYEIYNSNSDINDDKNDNENSDDIGQNGSSNQGGESSDNDSQSGSSSSGNNNGGSSSGGSSSGGNGSKPSSNDGNKPSTGSSSSNVSQNENKKDDLTNDELNSDVDGNKVSKEDNDVVLDENSTNIENNNESNINEDKKGNNIYPIVIVFGICLLSVRLIIYVIRRFKHSENDIYN